MADIQEVLREMREEFANDAPVMRWADAIEAAMREKDAEVEAAREWLRGHAEIDKAKIAEIERLRALLSHWYEMWNDGIPNPDGDVLYDTGAALAGKEDKP